MTIITCARCTRTAPHEARGLCHRCYNLAHWRGLHEVYTLGRRAPAKHDRRAYWREYKRMKRHADGYAQIPDRLESDQPAH